MTQPADPYPLDSRTLRPGMVVGGKFALLRRLGEGAVGVVFEAEDTWIGRRVALKVLHSHLTERSDVLARFRREARATAMTGHPNIVAVFEVGQWHDGSPYIVQELLDGETLRERLLRAGKMTPLEAIEIAVPIMGALDAAHRAGVVHRDIKPENIFLARGTVEGGPAVVPKLIDFGVAKIATAEVTTLTGSLIGTPMYMSPEQAAGAPADGRTDVWAMGAVMYELLSDHCPYEGVSSPVILAKILTEPFAPLRSRVKSVPAELEGVVHRALARDPSARFATMGDFLQALLDYASAPDPTLSVRHARSLAPPAPPGAPLVPPALSGPLPAVDVQLDLAPPAEDAHAEDAHAEDAPAEDAPAEDAPAGDAHAGDAHAGDALLEDAAPDDAPTKITRPEEAPPLGTPPEWARPMVQPELGWYEGRPPPRAPRDLSWYVSAAGEALRDNALDEAIDHAEHAVATCLASGEVLGQMRLVQAIALRWLGHYADSERCALEAAEALPHGGPGWYAALGHLAVLGGYLGNNDRFSSIAAELTAMEAKGPVSSQHVMAACRLSVSLVRAGLVDRAARVLASARAAAEAHTEDEPMVRAWIFVVAAEFAMHGGDPAGYIQHLEAAVTCFSEAGDVRHACLSRANIGNGYLQLGAYARAKGLLREAIAVGEPMRLGFIAPVRANLGFVHARLGDLGEALEIETAALDQCIREGYRRFETVARIYLAQILWLRAESALDGAAIAPGAISPGATAAGRAEEELRAAVAGSTSAPPIRAYALANLAALLFALDRPGEAHAAADEAMSILRDLEGVEEGESLIRLQHALGLEAIGDAAGAAAAVGEARRRLLERAGRINDPRLRRSFLDHIPENARTLAMASRYKAPAR